MADLIFGCVKEIGKCLWPPVKCHIDYWWCFDNNIQGLREGVGGLDRETDDMNQKIEEDRLQARKVRSEVEDWLNNSNTKAAEAKRILRDDNIPKPWNLIWRYSVGKSAKKTAEEITKLRNDGNFNRISNPAPPAAMGSTAHIPTMDFESRKLIEEDIIESLKNSSVTMIGICGMGGVGKTTMVQRIKNRVREENIFDEVVMVVVSQQVDMLKIQEEIAELLGMKFDVKFMSARANKLHTRLIDEKRKIIIFDDVWKSLNLEELGVPFERGFERCKILFTSRSTGIYGGIKDKKVFELKILKEKEAWILFKEKAGDRVEDSDLLCVAKDVVTECKGLPIALVTVGMALQNKSISAWRYYLSQLKRSNPTDIEDALEGVYKPLKLSYDSLENEREGLLFLLCCLFPEDYDIPVEHLTCYSIGLRIFDEIASIEEARNGTHALVENLKSRFLLIDGRDKHHVKMHDVVRDVAIFIGSKEKDGFLKSLEDTSMDSQREDSFVNCNWMSVSISNERINLPLGLHFPKLRLLMMLKSTSDISFEGMENLNVLYFSMFKSCPPTLGLLKNLRTLHLFDCDVGNISVIGESANLEILICFGCENIEELPIEIGRLNRLRLLDLCNCKRLQTIAFGIISSLVRLKELKMLRSFSNWEAEEKGKERRNAALTELQSLPNLTCLQIEISDWNLAAQEICLSHKLVKYCINIYDESFCFDKRVHEKGMCLTLPRHITVGKWIHKLVRNTEVLELEGDGSNNFNLAEIETLSNLKLKNCSMVKKLVNTIDCKLGTPNQNVSLCNLTSIHIWNCSNLQYLFSPNQNVSLCNLTSIHIWNCSNLQYLFPVSMARNLLQLEMLDIHYCDTMEQVFWNEINSNTASIEFSKLKILKLRDLSNLTVFCQGVESIQFPMLIEMEIQSLPKFNSIQFPLNSEPFQDDSPFHFLCNQKVETGVLKRLKISYSNDNSSNILCHHIPINFFSNLEELKISNLNGIRNLMSSSIAKNFVSLNYLYIESCQAMVEVIEQVLWNEITDTSIEFPKLKTLKLRDLPNLTAFWKGDESIKFPQLTNMKIENLPKLNSLFPLNSEPPHDDTSFHFLCNHKVEIGGLNSLTINNLKDNISNIWCHHIPINFFSNLEELKVSNLNGIRNLMSSSIVKNLVSLKSLSIRSCQEMVEVIEDEEEVVGNQNVSLCNLKTISIWKCSNLQYLFPVSMARNLLQLEMLDIHYCDTMEQVFWNDIKSITYASIEFSKLKTLQLKHLPNLIAFCQGVESIQFPNLTKMEIGYLPKLNSLTPLNSEPPHDDSSFHFLCNQKVEIVGLQILTLYELKDNISNIWCNHIPINFFSNLEKLKVSNFNGIRNLMSSSIAKNLVSLHHLYIQSCQEMVEVIEDEEEVVDMSLFPALKYLTFVNLLKLRSFCQWKHAFELPLLENVKIVDCPHMETFTLGSLSTPYIYKFTINRENIDYTKDLNVAIHHFKIKANEGEGSSMSRERY